MAGARLYQRLDAQVRGGEPVFSRILSRANPTACAAPAEQPGVQEGSGTRAR